MSILFGLVFVVLGLAFAVMIGLFLYKEKGPAKATKAVARVGKAIKV